MGLGHYRRGGCSPGERSPGVPDPASGATFPLSPSPQEYESSSKMEQFVTRFLLRETRTQLQTLQGSLECASDTIEEQAGWER